MRIVLAAAVLLMGAGCSAPKKYDVLQAPAPRAKTTFFQSRPAASLPRACPPPSLPPCEIEVPAELLTHQDDEDCPGGCCRLPR